MTKTSAPLRGGTFTMEGGAIIANTAASNKSGGITMTSGTFLMNGGEITSNTGDTYGSGVCMTGGVFTMTGGKISDNTVNVAEFGTNPTYGGGGVYVGPGANMTMSGFAEISQNKISGTVDNYGGGVFVLNGTFTMGGGTISGNTGGSGGGVSSIGGTVHLTKGMISGNTASDEGKNLGDYGGGIYLRGGTFDMTGGTVTGNSSIPAGGNDSGGGDGIYFESAGTYTISNGNISGDNDGIGISGQDTVLNLSGGSVSACSTGVNVCMYGHLNLNGSASITDCAVGVGLEHDSTFEMTGGTISLCTEAGIAAAGYYGFGSINSKCTVTGGTVSDNPHGIRMQNIDVTLGGTPVFSGNTDGNAACDLYYDGGVSGSITLLPDLQNVRLGLVFAPDALPEDGILTSGYFEGAENCFYLGDSRTDVKLLPMETEVWGESGPETVTELALTCHFSLIIEGEEAPISGDYIYNTYLNSLLYTYDDNQNMIFLPDIEALLVKESDEDYHYTFKQFTDDQGEPYDFEQNSYPLTADTVLYAAFEGSSHVWDSWQDNGETHTHTCGTCEYSTEASWGDWVDQQDGQTHKRFCPDGCGAEELSQHEWGSWTDSGDGVNHYHTCTQEGCTVREEQAHTYPNQWTQKDSTLHYQLCEDCQYELTANHTWGEWLDNQDGNHIRTCTDGCGATQTELHNWGAWVDNQDGTNHTRTCSDGCGAEQTANHTWGEWSDNQDGNHIRTCSDGCGATQTEQHNWGAWVDNQDGTNHTRTCSDGCGAEQTATHTWGEWSDNQDGINHKRICTDGCGAEEFSQHEWGSWTDSGDGVNHYHTCTQDGCTAREEQAHTYPDQWTQKDDTLHYQLCEDCQYELTASHAWGQWTDNQDGINHKRICTDGCGAEELSQHDWGNWTDSGDGVNHYHTCTQEGCTAREEQAHTYPNQWTQKDGTSHRKLCEDCQYELTATHTWGDWSDNQDGNHIRTCTDGCGASQTEQHNWGEWSDNQDGINHKRICTDGCGAEELSQHDWGSWTDSGDGENHYHTCTQEGCTAREEQAHTYPDQWTQKDETLHYQLCEDCQYELTASHTWGAWVDNQDGENHTRTCTDGCGASQTEQHNWQAWYETEGETLTRNCGGCTAQERKADERHVVAALLGAGGYRPFYTLQSAFDAAEPGETVCFVYDPEGIGLNATLVIAKSVLLGAVVRTVGEDFRASYSVCSETILLYRADGFDGTMIRIAQNADVSFETLKLEGGASASPAVECYGTLTVTGGEINALCAIRVRTTATRRAARSQGATLCISGNPVLGKILLDDPVGSEIPCVDLEGFGGALTLVIGENRPYGVFAYHASSAIVVEGGARWEEGLSRREVRLQDGMFLCGGFDLTVSQSALGEITIGGQCDEYLSELSVTLNGEELLLTADGGAFVPYPAEVGFSLAAELSVGGTQASLGLVSFDETTGLLIAPEGATFRKDGALLPLNGADPFLLPLAGDTATVEVDGTVRTLEFSRPVGTAFVYNYLTDGGILFAEVDYTNYERIRAGAAVYETLTDRQREVVDEKLRDTAFGSFMGILDAVERYLAAQNQKADAFFRENEALSKSFGDVSASDRDALGDALEEVRNASEEERHFLDEAAKSEGYSGVEGMLEDLICKSEFEAERETTLENLGTILRGCDGSKVRQELSHAIETVEGAAYERCTEDDLRLDYLVGQKESLETAVRMLENIRAEERARSALDAYLTEKEKSGCYSREALGAMAEIIDEVKDALSRIDPEDKNGGTLIEDCLNGGIGQLDEVRADAIVCGEGTPEQVVSADYPDEIETMFGYLMRESGFRGGSKLSLVMKPAEGMYGDRVVLFGFTVQLIGDDAEGPFRVCLLLPERARGYTGYRVVASGETVEAEVNGNVLSFDAEGGTEFTVIAQKKVDLVWLIVLLACLCGLETAALVYVAGYLFRNRTAALSPLLLAAVLIPASAGYVCAALGAVCLGEGIALAVLLARIHRRETVKWDK